MSETYIRLNNHQKIANRYYEQNKIDLAQENDKIFCDKNAVITYGVAEKWFNRGYDDISKSFEELGLEIAFNDPDEAENYVVRLIDTKKFGKAEEVGNKLLERWAEQRDEEIRCKIDNKMALAIKINSQSYYYIFKDKLINPNKNYIVHNYFKYFDNKSLKTENKDLNSMDYIIHRTYINLDFLIEHKLTIDQARKNLEDIFCDLQKKNDIVSVMLEATFLHAKHDPYFKLHIFNKIPNNEKYRGMYRYYWDSIEICKISLEDPFFKDLLMHEIYHLLMHLVFPNKGDKCYDGKPYLLNDKKAKKDLKRIIKELQLDLKRYNLESNNSLNTISAYIEVFEYYKNKEMHCEFIAYFIEIIANLEYNDIKNQQILKPIYDYWMKYIQPRIKKYIKDHSKSYIPERFLNLLF